MRGGGLRLLLHSAQVSITTAQCCQQTRLSANQMLALTMSCLVAWNGLVHVTMYKYATAAAGMSYIVT